MAVKSIVLSPCIIVAVLYALICNNNLVGCAGRIPNYKELEVNDDLPLKSSLEKYLVALEKIIYFVNLYRFYTDRHLFFGLFLTGVNLKSTLKMRGHGLSQQKRTRLERLLNATDAIEKYFLTMVAQYIQNMNSVDVAPVGIINLFLNESSWPEHLRNFNVDLLNKTEFYTRKELEEVYFKWPLYKNRVYNYVKRNYQNPSESDTCLELLSQNPSVDDAEPIKLTHCQVPYACAKRVLNGTRFGFGRLSRIFEAKHATVDLRCHDSRYWEVSALKYPEYWPNLSGLRRLTFLIVARFSRGCTLLSREEDRHLVDSICASAYNEAEFTAYHDFETIDLLMEIMSLCGLEGHAQFLRRSWIDEAIDYQSPLGCFNLSKPMEDVVSRAPGIEHVPWQFTISDQSILHGVCNVRSTAAAAGMLSAAIRFILEYHY